MNACKNAEDNDRHLQHLQHYSFTTYNKGHFPNEYRIESICMKDIKSKIDALAHIPNQAKSVPLCNEAVKHNGLALRYVPDDLRTEEICLTAVINNGLALQYVPDRFKHELLCLEAIKSNAYSLQDVPYNLRTEDMCAIAIKKIDKNNFYHFDFLTLIFGPCPRFLTLLGSYVSSSSSELKSLESSQNSFEPNLKSE